MATGANDAQGIWQYGEDDSNATFSALMNRLGSSTSTQFGVDRTRFGTVETNITNLQTANSTTNKSGLVPVIPTGVAVNAGTGSFNSSTGVFTFSGASTVSMNGVFTSSFTNYKIVMNLWSTGADQAVSMRFRNAGNDYTAASYQNVYFETQAGNSTFTFTSAANSTLPRISRASTTGAGGIAEVFAPYASVYTRMTMRSQDSQYFDQGGISYNTTQSFDGFSIIGGGALSGTINVYGMRYN